MVNLICGSIVFCIASTIRIFWVIALTLLWVFKKKRTLCLVFNELYSGGLMTFHCLSILTASGRRVRFLSFCPHALVSWTQQHLGGGQRNLVFLPSGILLESRRWPEIWSIRISEWCARGLCPGVILWISFTHIIRIIITFVLFFFGHFLFHALIPPWIRQWLTENLYNKVGGKIYDRQFCGYFFIWYNANTEVYEWLSMMINCEFTQEYYWLY